MTATENSLDQWNERMIEREGEMTMAQTETTTDCIYCGCAIEDHITDIVPTVDDDDTWELIAESHRADCEWIETRAHRVNVL